MKEKIEEEQILEKLKMSFPEMEKSMNFKNTENPSFVPQMKEKKKITIRESIEIDAKFKNINSNNYEENKNNEEKQFQKNNPKFSIYCIFLKKLYPTLKFFLKLNKIN